MDSTSPAPAESPWPGRVRWLADRAIDPARPLFCGLVFWITVLVLPVAVSANYLNLEQPYGLWPVLACSCALVALWLVLPWEPTAPLWRKAMHPLFVAVALLLNFVTSYNTIVVWLLLALANCTFLFGVRGAVALCTALMLVSFGGSLVYPGHSLVFALVQALVVPALAVFVVGLVHAVTEARARREESQRLLGELAAAHAELRAHAEQMRDLAVAEERARMSREMHDSIGHYLTVIKVGLTNAERFRTLRPEQAWDEVRQAKELTGFALADTRRWVRAMRPLGLEGASGSAALAELARSFDGTGVRVEFSVRGRELPLLGDTELVLYRVLQEGLTNVLRHAGASRAEAVLHFTEDRVSLAVSDDGGGTGPGDCERGFGLSSLAERAESLGGGLVAHNADRGGFLLRVELPVARA
ncbi:signal transduction histidine kinase [Kutzneria viridogrisea]|uniref:histidine kinase n=1 Tax=Kutzneria viridogrisea TaxID=47990 RepID=A0ABR6BPC7_9PSEU|nr:sensor histidine kinase [Kutzneria albida]MBA8928419.1 signal transduction histidine kinase [Kutzneria viridogrisea]